MIFGLGARSAELKLRTIQADELQARIRSQSAQERNLAELQSKIKFALLNKAIAALEGNDLDTFNKLSGQALMPDKIDPTPNTVDLGFGPGDTMTPHEKVLDTWRVITTIILILALFIVLGFVLHSPTVAKTATPYISLVSGLAGIALGWMFASAGKSDASKPGRTTSGPDTRARGSSRR